MQVLLLKPRPPPVQLPNDIVRSILERLEHFRDVAAARAVCRTWRNIIDISTSLWRKLVFGLPRRMPENAETWYRKAARCGNAQAQFLLALMYTYGYAGSS